MKFLIISIFDSNCHNGPSFAEIAKVTHESLIDYCELHDYDYLIMDRNPDPSRHISWGRTKLVQNNLKNYDWIWCIDSDVMIMNHTIKLENIVDNNYSILVGANNLNIDSINTGSIFWKNSPESECWLELMYADKEFANKGYWEQSTLIKLLKENSILDDGTYFNDTVKIVSPKLFNSFYHYWFPPENYQHGDFVVHLAGSDNDYRLETLKNLIPYIIKPIPNIQEKVTIWNK